MAANDLNSINFDADESRYNRQNRINQPDFAPGQGVFNDDSIFSSSTISPDNSSMNDIFSSNPISGGQNDIFGGMNGAGNDIFGASPNSMQVNNQNNNNMQQKDPADQFWGAVSKGAKGTFSFAKDLTKSTSGLTALFWQKFGMRTTVTGIAGLVVGVISKLFGLSIGLDIAVGSCLASAVGVFVFMFKTEEARTCSSQYKEENNTNQGLNNEVQNDFSDSNSANDNPFGDMSWDNNDSGFNNSESFSEDWGSDFSDNDDFGEDEEEDDWDFDMVESGQEPDEGMSVDEALNSLQEIDKGMYTRQYLYDMFTKVLPTMKPDFADEKEIDEDDDLFLEWGDSLRDAGEVAGCKEDYLPELLSLKENLFTITLTCDRPTGFKPDLVAKELANIYAYQGGKFNPNVYAKAEVVGKECIITIFTGATAMISLKDMMLQVKDYILDSSNYIPIVFGIDPQGEVLKYDFKKLESIIITGMPRMGKSWFVQAILTQMCAFVPPSELNIYICDPKEGISDFKSFVLPHVKKFVSGDNNIVACLRELVKVEGPRRKKIIGDAEFVNIWDYKERYPDVKLPIIYVVVDEVVTLASRMDKEVNNEFRMLLRELISQLPALGIRAFLIPHVLNNDIIEKKTSDLVPCKISVCGDADHVEKATGSKPKDFPYKLTNKGDMAIRMPAVSPDTMFVHGPALTSSNPKNNDLFDYLRRVWSKLEPEEVDNSVAVNADSKNENEDILKSLQDDLGSNESDSNLSDDFFIDF